MSKIAYTTKQTAIDPLNPSIPTEVVTAADMNEIKDSVNSLYDKTVTACLLVNQSGTGNPVITTVFNDTGLTFSASRTGVGTYLIQPSVPPALNKTMCIGGVTPDFGVYYDGTFININTVSDNALGDYNIKLEIYP